MKNPFSALKINKKKRLEPGGIYGDFSTWEEAMSQCSGYDGDDIFTKVSQATLKVKKGEAVFERDSVLFDHIEYSWQSLAALMYFAARSHGKLSVLDFGGALGSSYFQNRQFFSGLDVEWSIVEQKHFVDFGQREISDDTLKFYAATEACLAERQPNVVLLSSVLQYIEDPYALTEALASLDVQGLIIDRTPFHHENTDQIKVQVVPEVIYKATYPMRLLNLQRIKDIVVAHGFSELEEFESTIDPSGEYYSSLGVIFNK